jgi:hypothetical protein
VDRADSYVLCAVEVGLAHAHLLEEAERGRRLTELNSALTQAKAAAEAASTAKSQFLAIVSHEIRHVEATLAWLQLFSSRNCLVLTCAQDTDERDLWDDQGAQGFAHVERAARMRADRLIVGQGPVVAAQQHPRLLQDRSQQDRDLGTRRHHRQPSFAWCRLLILPGCAQSSPFDIRACTDNVMGLMVNYQAGKLESRVALSTLIDSRYVRSDAVVSRDDMRSLTPCALSPTNTGYPTQ